MTPFGIGWFFLLALWGMAVYWGSSDRWSHAPWTRTVPGILLLPALILGVGILADFPLPFVPTGTADRIGPVLYYPAAIGTVLFGWMVLIRKDSLPRVSFENGMGIPVLSLGLVPVFSWVLVRTLQTNLLSSGRVAGAALSSLFLFFLVISVAVTRKGIRPAPERSNTRVSLLMISLGIGTLGLVVLSSYFEELVTIYRMAERQPTVDPSHVQVAWLAPVLTGLFLWGFLDNRKRVWGTTK
jgi:hypothetical protein